MLIQLLPNMHDKASCHFLVTTKPHSYGIDFGMVQVNQKINCILNACHKMMDGKYRNIFGLVSV